jgi:hypothetical protein
VKKFYSIRLKYFKEYIPLKLAKVMLKQESNLIKWLGRHKALTFKYVASRKRLDCYAKEKFLTMGRLLYPDIFDGRGRVGFMELYISSMIKKRMQLKKTNKK